jgi:hypothetical protein
MISVIGNIILLIFYVPYVKFKVKERKIFVESNNQAGLINFEVKVISLSEVIFLYLNLFIYFLFNM